jgi:hypothetical protein
MDIKLLIIFIFVILIIIYIIYEFYLSYSEKIYYVNIDLNAKYITYLNPSNMINPSSTYYAIGFWINVNSLNYSSYADIITRYQIGTDNSKYDFLLYLSKYKLLFSQNKQMKSITIMPNFPLRKWTHIIISVNPINYDIYINGKLVLSHISQRSAQFIEKNMEFRFGKFDAKIKDFKRWATTISPNSAWNEYLKKSY